MLGFKNTKKEIKDYAKKTGNPYLTPTEIEKNRWLAGASHCIVRELMRSGEIPSLKIGVAFKAHYLDIIEYLEKNYICNKYNEIKEKSKKLDNKSMPTNKKQVLNICDKFEQKSEKITHNTYYQNNKEEIRRQQKEYYKRHKEKIKKQATDYYFENKNTILAKNKNSQRKKEYDEKYYLKNKAFIQERKKNKKRYVE